MKTRVKICGVTSEAQARMVADIGADAIGVNFVAESPRRVDEATARAIVRAVGDRVLVVGIVAGLELGDLKSLRDRTGLGCMQLNGDEPDSTLDALLPHAYRAVAVAGPEDVARAGRSPGEYVLVDAKSSGARGGTGQTFDWELVVELATRRKLALAGGLRPENVRSAIARVRPFCVDVASGVESAPGIKDPERVRAFLESVRAADDAAA